MNIKYTEKKFTTFYFNLSKIPKTTMPMVHTSDKSFFYYYEETLGSILYDAFDGGQHSTNQYVSNYIPE